MLDYRHLFEQSPARLLVLEPRPPAYKILCASDAYLAATMTTREIVSRPTFEVFPDNPLDASANGVRNLSASFEHALATRSADVMSVQKYDIRDRSARFVERYWTPTNASVIGGDGTVAALIHRVEDVTSFVQQGEVLRGEAAHLKHEILTQARQLAVANATLRDRMDRNRRIAAIVSHDLRSPLAAIQNSAYVLARSIARLEIPPLPIIERIQSSVNQMVSMLNDLNDFSLMQTATPIARKHTNVRGLCEQTVQEAQLAHPTAEIELVPGKNIAAEVDPTRFRQMLTNLISNAASYGASNRPIRVSLRRITGACVITVSNEGTPIPEDMIPSLFEPFRRGPGQGTDRQRGHMGLGLFIVHQIVEAHGGTIAVESTPQGTHFKVSIPVVRA